MNKLKVRCAAKVNLCLEIVNKRPDGYHNLRSLMTAVSVWDELVFEPSEKFALTEFDGTVLDERNTVFRAATSLAKLAEKDLTTAVKLKKVIPSKAGLGGGSSDGAATLLALRRLWKLKWSWRKLTPLAARIGADVPFFLVPTGAAIVEGIGEILTPVKLPTLWLVLAKPEADMSTQEAFDLWDEQPVHTETDPEKLVTSLWQKDVKTIRRLAVNAFEEIIAAKVPDVTELKQRLMAAGAVTALMSGSGTTVFGIFFDRESAKSAMKFVQPAAKWCQLARTVRQSVIVKSGERR
ncbi:MAG: 4-(cytidine 5'-diphospho)-2-C-methyl-D-erythritol kinase [Armatimonadota bacterium]|nr:4-(cytidine 5'-diphospho)-2-C-methyl-D-erythritol kinase [Armatimonadota bacterium]MDW8142480.1 4-(cytidine 5'-diphospho)-2-C-methyl-D-erythritol kinase [Armatimonadota bacterium]